MAITLREPISSHVGRDLQTMPYVVLPAPERWPSYSTSLFLERRFQVTPALDSRLPLGEQETISYGLKARLFDPTKREYVPRTELGKRLLLLRKQAIRAGMKLLSADEVLEEVRRRRGEPEEDEETHLP